MRTNSLLGNFEELEASINPKEEIKRFIEDNYMDVSKLQISEEPNENGKYEVSCRGNVVIKNRNITSLTTNTFEWGEVNGGFDCSFCGSLISLEGAPKKVGESFCCNNCNSLTSLKGAPKEVGGSFDAYSCESLTSLKGAPKEVGWVFDCSCCKSLKSLEGIPEKIIASFNCSYCNQLTSLKGAPKEVGGNFNCKGYKGRFNLNNVAEICNVKGSIYL